MSVAALILAGGASRRMGRDKLSLPWSVGGTGGPIGSSTDGAQGAEGSVGLDDNALATPAGAKGAAKGAANAANAANAAKETVLAHVVKVAAEVADVVYLVVPPETEPGPNLDVVLMEMGQVPVITYHDKALYQGPLQALNRVWQSLGSHEAIFVIPGDLPGLTPRVLKTCKSRLDVLDADYDGAAVVRNGRWQPLLACYKSVAGRAWSIAEDGETRILRALESLRIVAVDERLQAWPAWWTKPIHTPEDYAAWLQWQQNAGAQTSSSRGGGHVET